MARQPRTPKQPSKPQPQPEKAVVSNLGEVSETVRDKTTVELPGGATREDF